MHERSLLGRPIADRGTPSTIVGLSACCPHAVLPKTGAQPCAVDMLMSRRRAKDEAVPPIMGDS